LEYPKNIDITELREKLNCRQEELGEVVGVGRQSIAKYEKGVTDIPLGTKKLLSLLYWKELGLPRTDVLEELRLNDYVIEPGAAYDPQTPREQYLHKELQEAKKREEIYQMTIRALQDRKPNE